MQLNENCRLEIGKQQLIFADAATPVSLSFAETAILQCLIQHEGNVVPKETLLQQGWPGRIVAASSLMQCISQLRKKLEAERDIELTTIPRHGYALHLSHSKVAKLSTSARSVNSAKANSKVTENSVTESTDNEGASNAKLSVNPIPQTFKRLKKLWPLLMLPFALLALWHYLPAMSPAMWHASSAQIQINQAPASIKVYRTADISAPTASQLQAIVDKQITPEPSLDSPFSHYQGFALLSEHNQSLALCPNYADNRCPGNKLINISSDSHKGGHIRLSDFLATKIRLEQKTYNKLLLTEVPEPEGHLHEEVYHADLYFKVQDDLLVRSDFRISLVHLEADTGLFYFAACITDEDCANSPIRFEVRGNFQKQQQQWQGQTVDAFSVEVNKTDLNSPNKLSGTATGLYLALRKQHLTQESMTFYRLYQDDGTAVWVVPLQQNNIVWMQRQKLSY